MFKLEEPKVQMNRRYTVKDAASVLQVCRTTIYEKINSGELVSRGTKKVWFYGKDILNLWKLQL